MIVDVKCDDDTTHIARVVGENENEYTVNFLERVHSSVFNFRQNVESVSKESVSGFYDVENLEKTGLYVHTHRGYEIIDDSEDEDFTCSGSETDESEDDVSLVDEDET